MKFSEIIQKNNELGKNSLEPSYGISLLSNIIINQLNPILELELRSKGVNATVSNGDYDNILQDSSKESESSLVIIFWELANLIDGFQYKANLLTKEETNMYISRFKNEIDLLFNNIENSPLVIVSKFSSLVFNYENLALNNFDFICKELNEYLVENKRNNMFLIDIDKVLAKISIIESVDFRNYYSSKSLYTVAFLKEFSSYISPIVLSVTGKSKKAIIFDCDNTLWKGIIGEDQVDGLFMSSASGKGVVYEEVQSIAKELVNKGIILGLNSKNNSEDVEEVLNRSLMVIGNDDIIIKKINWNDKVSNLKEIARELNIGIESIVFVDDSDFEINLVKKYLPLVKTIQVPIENYLYPSEIRKNLSLFFNFNITDEDLNRGKMYAQEAERREKQINFVDIEEYISSLGLELKILINDVKNIVRVAQLTQKTNQFNLTTKRYTETEVMQFLKKDNFKIFAFEVKDKYGDFGLTGEAFIEIIGNEAIIDSFLMSCRVLGRNIEFKFIEEVFCNLKKNGITKVKASYIPTFKNDQVIELYDKIGFTLLGVFNSVKNYEINLNDYKPKLIDYINVTYEKQS
jgi:FkbH-like protein